MYLVVPTTSFWGALTHLSLPLWMPWRAAMHKQNMMSSHVTLRPEAILSSPSQIMASFTPFLEMDKSGVTQRPKEVKKEGKPQNMHKSRV